VKVVELDEAGTVTDVPGTGSNALLLDSDTTVPPAGDALLSEAVHVMLPPLFTLVGVQEKEDSAGTTTPPPVTTPPVAEVAMA